MNQLLGICIFAGSFGFFFYLVQYAGASDLKYGFYGAALIIISALAYFARLIIEVIVGREP
jgi:hypothetical protein